MIAKPKGIQPAIKRKCSIHDKAVGKNKCVCQVKNTNTVINSDDLSYLSSSVDCTPAGSFLVLPPFFPSKIKCYK